MAFGLPKDTRGQVLFLIIVGSLAGAYFLYDYVNAPRTARIAAARHEADSLDAIVRKAKADLASGSVESMRRAVEQYRAALGLMRRLVPEENEVPQLIDDISTRAKIRGITLGKFQPLSPMAGPPLHLRLTDTDTAGGKKPPPAQPAFDVYRYRLEVYGHYDQLGEFLTDVAALSRIMVAQDIVLKPAVQTTQKFLADTTGGLLEADLTLRTYVKRKAPAGGANAQN